MTEKELMNKNYLRMQITCEKSLGMIENLLKSKASFECKKQKEKALEAT